VIIGSRKEMLLENTPDIIQVIGRRQIDETKPTSTGELIEYASGVCVETGTGSGLPERSVVSINGLPANYTLVLLDGVRLLTEHIHSGQNLEFIPTESVERLEIMRGAASAQFGSDAIGGIVNVVTRKCRGRREASLTASSGSYGTYESGAHLLLPILSSIRLSSSFNWKQSDGIPLTAPAHRVDNTGYRYLNLFNRFDADLLDATNLFGSINWVSNTMDWRGDETTGSLISSVMGMMHSLSPKMDLSAMVAHSKWDAELNGEINVLFESEAHATFQISDHHTLMTGLDHKWNDFERTAVDAPDQQSHGLFLQHGWIDPRGFSLMMAARYDNVEGIGGALSPKFSLLVQPTGHLRLRASVGRGFHAPTLQELYEEGYGHGGSAYRFGNPDLEPEFSTAYTVGIEIEPAHSVQLMLYAFYNDLTDMIVPVYQGPWDEDPSIDVWKRLNIENAEVYGAEANLRLYLTEFMRVESGYTYSTNQDRDSGRKLSYSPGSSAYGKLMLSSHPGETLALSGFVGIRAVFDRQAWNWKPASDAAPDNPDGLTTPMADYTKLDAGLTLALSRTYEAYLKVENILGENIENLDDAYTVIDGEPVFHVGVRYGLPFSPW